MIFRVTFHLHISVCKMSLEIRISKVYSSFYSSHASLQCAIRSLPVQRESLESTWLKTCFGKQNWQSYRMILSPSERPSVACFAPEDPAKTHVNIFHETCWMMEGQVTWMSTVPPEVLKFELFLLHTYEKAWVIKCSYLIFRRPVWVSHRDQNQATHTCEWWQVPFAYYIMQIMDTHHHLPIKIY